jgi:hypothetical protein
MIDPDFINPVWRGYPWEQHFTLDPAMAPAGSQLRITLTEEGQTRGVSFDRMLARPAADQHVITLTPEQTRQLRAPGTIWGDFVVRAADGSESPLNLRISIPVEIPLTPAAP